MKKLKNAPNWFEGDIYENGALVIIESSGEEFELNNLELSIYDLLCGCHTAAMNLQFINHEQKETFLNGIEWFIQNNHNAYMKLLHDKYNDIINLVNPK